MKMEDKVRLRNNPSGTASRLPARQAREYRELLERAWKAYWDRDSGKLTVEQADEVFDRIRRVLDEER